MINKGLFTSKTGEWETPDELFNKLNSEFGFEVDVCATKENRKCDKYWTIKDDGLSKNWNKYRCWCNPPYGREIGKWIEKASLSENLVVMLIPSRTDTKWFHNYIYNKAEIRFIKGRIRFGDSVNSAPFPSMIVIFKSRS